MATQPSNALQNVLFLRNTMVALRHGQSLANVAGIICSDPTIACNGYGLSPTGQEQAAAAGQQIIDLYHQANMADKNQDIMGSKQRRFRGLVILSSDLLRAKETAETVFHTIAEHNKTVANDLNFENQDTSHIPVLQNEVILDVRLRERGFGAWDGQPDTNYNLVWEQDALDASHRQHDVESVESVRQRASECILDWEERLCGFDVDQSNQTDGYLVVLVAHGDVLQILQTAFENVPGTMHRTMPHLETATLRVLELRYDR